MTALTSLDMRVLEMLAAFRDPLGTYIFIGITELGGPFFLGGLALCLALFPALRSRYALAAGLVSSVAGAGAVTLLLKEIVERARPAEMYQAYLETGYSFPSGHATLAAAFYGFCMYLAVRTMPKGWSRTLVVTLLGLLILGIGFSRLYLGVHYLSDVVAGFALGALCAWLGSLVAKRLERLFG